MNFRIISKYQSAIFRHGLKDASQRITSAVLALLLLMSSVPLEGFALAPDPLPAAGAPGHKPDKNKGVSPVRRGNRPTRHTPATAPTGPGTQLTPQQALPDSINIGQPLTSPAEVVEDEITDSDGKLSVEPVDTVKVDINADKLADELPEYREALENDSTFLTAGEAMAADSLAMALEAAKNQDEWVPTEVEFSPDPTKAVWFAALFPGLGQVYNRRYWKLPIVVGGYLGLAYATNWNNSMLTDYTKAYADLLDNDPSTKSYMDFFSPNIKEEDLDRSWLQNVLSSRKNYFRRNRDLCIICMVGVYLLAMVDAYVDASLSHFDISPELSMDVAPTLIQDGRQRYPSVGLVWAFNF